MRAKVAPRKPSLKRARSPTVESPERSSSTRPRTSTKLTEPVAERESRLADKKYQAWSPYVNASPFPDFGRPTVRECEVAHDALHRLHQAEVDKEFEDENTPAWIPHVLDAMFVAVLSQATGWSNAKRAMNSMKTTYGSVFAYDEIFEGGRDKLAETIKCGGLHMRKSMILMSILEEVKKRHGGWDLDALFNMDDHDAMKELLSYKYIGTKSASVVMSWSLKRNPFTVDTHVYRIAGLWGWRPDNATREKTQSHLEVMIPPKYKFSLHFLLIQHGRTCPACRGGGSQSKLCTIADQLGAVKHDM